MKLSRYITCCLCPLLFCSVAKSQLYKITLAQKTDIASLIVEGKVVEKHAFWNAQHNMIYTSNTVRVYKLFKGDIISRQIEIVTQGGSVGGRSLIVSDVLQLNRDDIGMFFCFPNRENLRSPVTKNILYDVYSSSQGFLRYDEENDKAYAPFTEYSDIEATLYQLIKQRTGIAEKIIDTAFHLNHTGVISNGVGGVLSTINSFSPATVHAGALNDPPNNTLTINGSGFGNSPSGSAGLKFKDANNDHPNPDYKIPFSSPYIISWSDTKIVVSVPDRAGTGKFAVVLSDGTTVLSPSDLQVFFAVLDAEFSLGGIEIAKEPRLMNTNGSGGYSYQFSTSTAGGGKDFTASPAKQTFQRAVTTWREIVGANLTEGAATTLQKVEDDNINLVVFDNNNTGVPKMAAGVLESTYSWFSACQTSPQELLTAQKTGFDILIRNQGVSLGSNVSFEFGPCFPAVGSYDLEMIILHELGHALNLSHINDDFEDGGNGYFTVNPSKLMHYAILDFVDRRSPDASAYQGALYTTTPQGDSYGNCGLFDNEMTPLTPIVTLNDECPSTFPATPIADNTTIIFDLVHATSNKFGDPSFKQVTCSGSGTSVTNNAYYAFMSGDNTALALTISGYTTVPAQLNSCNAQAIRMSVYDVSTCPQGQQYPLPVACASFSSSGLINLSGLQQNHKYLLYFDGFRNTKASFNLTFNGDSTSHGPNTIVTVSPNPVTDGRLNVKIENATGSQYEYALFDVAGKLITTGKVSVTQSTQTFSIFMKPFSAGVYFLKIVDAQGNKVATTKILK